MDCENGPSKGVPMKLQNFFMKQMLKQLVSSVLMQK